jgi:hypothetical protein
MKKSTNVLFRLKRFAGAAVVCGLFVVGLMM